MKSLKVSVGRSFIRGRIPQILVLGGCIILFLMVIVKFLPILIIGLGALVLSHFVLRWQGRNGFYFKDGQHRNIGITSVSFQRIKKE